MPGAGCDFVNKPCIVNDMVPSYGEGFFCNTPLVFDISGDPILSPSCDVTHNHVTSCDLVDLISVGRQRIPEEYRYFTDQVSDQINYF